MKYIKNKKIKTTIFFVGSIFVLLFGTLLFVDTIVNKDKVLAAVYYITKPNSIYQLPQQKYYPCDSGINASLTKDNINKPTTGTVDSIKVDSTNEGCSKESTDSTKSKIGDFKVSREKTIGCTDWRACNYNENAVPGDNCHYAVYEIILAPNGKIPQSGTARVHAWITRPPSAVKIVDKYYDAGVRLTTDAGKDACLFELEDGKKVKDVIPNLINNINIENKATLMQKILNMIYRR